MLLLFVAADAYVQDPTSVTVRPKVGLLLSGEEAKGAAHIGVLKYINKANTSMGSIVKGM